MPSASCESFSRFLAPIPLAQPSRSDSRQRKQPRALRPVLPPTESHSASPKRGRASRPSRLGSFASSCSFPFSPLALSKRLFRLRGKIACGYHEQSVVILVWHVDDLQVPSGGG